ncbi:MAG: hypothetical protein C0591_06005 [Marinilabiliales bacterium]|nr:MAG: hypothetical protein C0591_06005 [Marinilabiliales bacterium]
MKKTYSILLLSILIIFSACREITVTTKINPDGSFTRVIKITGDSADVFRKDLPYPIDDSWLMEVKHDSADTSMYVTYTKTYSNSDLLNYEMQNDTGWMSQLDRKVDIKKRFGFFYSYITFCETYKAIKPFEKLNYPNKLTPEEIQYLSGSKIPITVSDSVMAKQVSDKFDELLIEALANEIISTLENGIKKLNDPQLNPETVEFYRDSIEYKLNDYYEDMNVYIDFYKEWTGNESVIKLKTLDPPLFKELDRNVSMLLNAIFMDSYSQTVEMPGLITETNAKSATGNKVSWNVNGDKFLFEDYKMQVESRVINYWMFALTGFLVLVLIVFLLMKTFR